MFKILITKSKRIFKMVTCGLVDPDKFEKRYMKNEDEQRIPGYEINDVDSNVDKNEGHPSSDDHTSKTQSAGAAGRYADDFSNVVSKKFDKFASSSASSESDFKMSNNKGSDFDDYPKKDKVKLEDIRLDFPQHMMKKIQPPSLNMNGLQL